MTFHVLTQSGSHSRHSAFPLYDGGAYKYLVASLITNSSGQDNPERHLGAMRLDSDYDIFEGA